MPEQTYTLAVFKVLTSLINLQTNQFKPTDPVTLQALVGSVASLPMLAGYTPHSRREELARAAVEEAVAAGVIHVAKDLTVRYDEEKATLALTSGAARDYTRRLASETLGVAMVGAQGVMAGGIVGGANVSVLQSAPRVRWTLTSDDDGHHYLVPADRLSEFEAALEASTAFWDDPPELDDETEDAELPPDPGEFDWVHAIEGGSLTFEAPEYDGKPVLAPWESRR